MYVKGKKKNTEDNDKDNENSIYGPTSSIQSSSSNHPAVSAPPPPPPPPSSAHMTPQNSVYFHPVYNPSGLPPPGQSPMYRPPPPTSHISTNTTIPTHMQQQHLVQTQAMMNAYGPPMMPPPVLPQYPYQPSLPPRPHTQPSLRGQMPFPLPTAVGGINGVPLPPPRAIGVGVGGVGGGAYVPARPIGVGVGMGAWNGVPMHPPAARPVGMQHGKGAVRMNASASGTAVDPLDPAGRGYTQRFGAKEIVKSKFLLRYIQYICSRSVYLWQVD